MPKRLLPCANGPSMSPSLSLSVDVKFSSMVIVPVLVMSPVRLVLARMPVEPLAPWIAIVPSFLTLLLLLIVTAAPPVGFTEPVEVMRTLSPEVVTGVVIAVLITCSAAAGVASAAARAPRPVEARRKRMVSIPCLQACESPFPATWVDGEKAGDAGVEGSGRRLHVLRNSGP